MAHQGSSEHSRNAASERDRMVRRVLYIEAGANLLVLAAKTVVGLATGSLAILGDALHSLADVANNVVALLVMRIADQPADHDHPYGHRKYETLAVFGLGGLLTVMAVEVALHALQSTDREVVSSGWGLWTMLGVLVVNIGIATWERRWARRLDSEILRADAQHTLGDVLTTCAVIVGWQLSARGPAWLDSAFALVVAGIVLYLAFGLFKRSIPVLVDSVAVAAEELSGAVESVEGVYGVARVRSRRTGAAPAVDVVVTVDPTLSTLEGHKIADEIERVLHAGFDIEDVTIHIEPHE